MQRRYRDLPTRLKRRGLLACVIALSAGGCANDVVVSQPSAPGLTPVSPPSDRAAESVLVRASRYYDEGDYSAVIVLLTGNRDWLEASASVQTRARKLLAFSHCIGGQATLCEWYFEAILERDPSFELTPYEVGHPAWDPAFRRAKLAVRKKKGS